MWPRLQLMPPCCTALTAGYCFPQCPLSSATLWRPIFTSSYLSSHFWPEAAKLLCCQHLGLFTSAWNKGHLQLLHHCITFLTHDSQVSTFESDKWYLSTPQSTYWTADALLESLSGFFLFVFRIIFAMASRYRDRIELKLLAKIMNFCLFKLKVFMVFENTA